LLEPLVVHRETFHDVFAQPLRGPDAELSAALGLHPVANGNDDIEVVVGSFVVFAIGGSYPEFPDN
jgi:hypothetical protein